MFKEVYKQALDKQNPKDGLLEEILLRSKSETLYKSKPKYNFTKITSYAASVAAVAVIAFAFAVYPEISGLHKQRRVQDNEYQIKTAEIQRDVNENNASEPDKNEAEMIISSSVDNKNATKKNNIETEARVNASKNNGAPAENQESADYQNLAQPFLEANSEDGFSVMSESEVSDASAQVIDSTEINTQEITEDNSPSSGGGGGANSRMAAMPELASEESAIAIGGDVIFDEASAINEALNYITTPYISADVCKQDSIWHVIFYTESEIITVSLNAHDGALEELIRQNI